MLGSLVLEGKQSFLRHLTRRAEGTPFPRTHAFCTILFTTAALQAPPYPCACSVLRFMVLFTSGATGSCASNRSSNATSMVNPSQLGTNNTCPTSTPPKRWRGNPLRSTPLLTPRAFRLSHRILNRSIARRGPEVSRPTSRRSRWRSTSFEILSISSGWMWSPRVVNDVVPTVACSTYEMATRDAEASAKYHTERRRSSVEYIRRKSEERKDRRSGACCGGQAWSGRNGRGTTSRKLQRSDGVRGRSSNARRKRNQRHRSFDVSFIGRWPTCSFAGYVGLGVGRVGELALRQDELLADTSARAFALSLRLGWQLLDVMGVRRREAGVEKAPGDVLVTNSRTWRNSTKIIELDFDCSS